MDFSVSSLPLVNALLNALATILLISGYICIRRGRIAVHRALMLGAFVTSVLFLTSYLIYHAHVGSRPFPGRGPIRTVYFTILISHIVLAAVIPPLAAVTLWRAFAAGSTATSDRAVDAAALALRLGHRHRRLLDALPDV